MKVISLSGSDVYMYCLGCKTLHTVPVNTGEPNSWTFNNDFEKPTLSPSLLVRGSIQCHSFIRNGQWVYLNDCQHDLAGKTVDMIDVDINRH